MARGDRHGAGLPVSAQTWGMAGSLAASGLGDPPRPYRARVGRVWRGIAAYGLPPRAHEKTPPCIKLGGVSLVDGPGQIIPEQHNGGRLEGIGTRPATSQIRKCDAPRCNNHWTPRQDFWRTNSPYHKLCTRNTHEARRAQLEAQLFHLHWQDASLCRIAWEGLLNKTAHHCAA